MANLGWSVCILMFQYCAQCVYAELKTNAVEPDVQKLHITIQKTDWRSCSTKISSAVRVPSPWAHMKHVTVSCTMFRAEVVGVCIALQDRASCSSCCSYRSILSLRLHCDKCKAWVQLLVLQQYLFLFVSNIWQSCKTLYCGIWFWRCWKCSKG